MADSVEKIIAKSLLQRITNDPDGLHRVVIDLDPRKARLAAARAQVYASIRHLLETPERTEQHIFSKEEDGQPYIQARLQGKVIQALVEIGQKSFPGLISFVRRDVDDGRYFNPDNMIRTVISVPMLDKIDADEEKVQSVLVELNINYSGGRPQAKARVRTLIAEAIKKCEGSAEEELIIEWKTDTSEQYVYAKLKGKTIRRLAELDQAALPEVDKDKPAAQPKDDQNKDKDWRAIYHIWPDFTVRAQIWRSVATVKADACRRSFDTTGRGIVWAIFDSGIDGKHPHFLKYSNLVLPAGLAHMDFTGKELVSRTKDELTDDYGHGTHVAGIIAGELIPDNDNKDGRGDGPPAPGTIPAGQAVSYKAFSLSRERDQTGKISYKAEPINTVVRGVAPECKLLSYKVLDKSGEGEVSTVIAAIQKVQELNGYGRNIIIHGVNMSLGYDFDPEWFACGQSPVCVEVDRLVRSGVAVVVAAGNTGKGFALTINDPGNAELAVTVGATHRDMPHRYGVSYFSSKGPTGDGRAKPDLLAPGERIISCAAGPDLETYKAKAKVSPDEDKNTAYYLERSGTSMAAPHVSGVIAGILSARGEFVGLPEDMKAMLVKNATDLGRERSFQGGGLVDMMRTIQAI